MRYVMRHDDGRAVEGLRQLGLDEGAVVEMAREGVRRRDAQRPLKDPPDDARARSSSGSAIADQDSWGRKSAFFDGVFIFRRSLIYVNVFD